MSTPIPTQPRALIAGRKSNKVKTSSGEGISLDTQDEYARQFCEREGWEVVGSTRDVISGRKPPMDRKELGSWLRDPEKLASFDVIVAYTVDRFSRGNDEDFSRIEAWAADNGKRLVMVSSAEGGIQYPSRNDADFWQWTAMKRQAGQEWENIRERNTRARRRIIDTSGMVGRAPWGYVIDGDGYAKTLVPTAQCLLAVRRNPVVGPEVAVGPPLAQAVPLGQVGSNIAATQPVSLEHQFPGHLSVGYPDGSVVIRSAMRPTASLTRSPRSCRNCRSH